MKDVFYKHISIEPFQDYSGTTTDALFSKMKDFLMPYFYFRENKQLYFAVFFEKLSQYIETLHPTNSLIYEDALERLHHWMEHFELNRPQEVVDLDSLEVSFDSAQNTAKIMRYLGFSDVIILPNEIHGHRVTEINQLAFEDSDAYAVVLPENLEVIGYKAFCNTTLTAIEFPKTLRLIKNSAFINSSLLEVTLHPNTKVEDYAFCSSNIVSIILKDRRKILYRSMRLLGATAFDDNPVENILYVDKDSNCIKPEGRNAVIFPLDTSINLKCMTPETKSLYLDCLLETKKDIDKYNSYSYSMLALAA